MALQGEAKACTVLTQLLVSLELSVPNLIQVAELIVLLYDH